MNTILLYSVLSAALFYLGSRAVITRPLWSRYPRGMAVLLDCPSCSGFWYGVLIAITVGRRYALSYLGLDPYDLLTPIVVGLGSVVMTPIVGGFMQAGLDQLGSAVGGDDDGKA